MTADEDTLICAVRWPVSRQALAKLAAGGQAFHYLRLDPAAEQRAEVTITPAARRIDFPGDTLSGSDIAPIDDGSHLTCLSHQGRERLTVDRQQVPSAGFQGPVRPAAGPWLKGAVQPDRRPGAAVTAGLDEAVTGTRYRHRVLADPGTIGGGLGHRLLELLPGDAGLHVGSPRTTSV
jgi:hypothetical protein